MRRGRSVAVGTVGCLWQHSPRRQARTLRCRDVAVISSGRPSPRYPGLGSAI